MNGGDFHAKHLMVGSVNGIPFDNFLTLRTEQTIDFWKIEGGVRVIEPLKVNRFFTNGANEKHLIDLRVERDNSVMVRK